MSTALDADDAPLPASVSGSLRHDTERWLVPLRPKNGRKGSLLRYSNLRISRSDLIVFTPLYDCTAIARTRFKRRFAACFRSFFLKIIFGC
jgi:hypothetical protein